MVGKLSRLFPLLLTGTVLLVGGCGGAPQDNENIGGGGSGDNRVIFVQVTGADGAVVLRLNTQDLTFSSNGSRQVSSFGADEQVQATVISSPAGQTCRIAPWNQQQVVVANQVTVECSGGLVRGKVKNFFTNDVVAGATVTVTRGTTGAYTSVGSTVTDANGNYSLAVDVTDGDRVAITVNATGYAPFTAVSTPNSLRPTAVENISLVPRQLPDTEDPTAPMTFRIGGIPVLTIPANGLVTEGGGAPSGSATATITLLDPAFSPRLLPGRYEALNGASIQNLESFGGITFELRDASGALLRLADGTSASLSIPTGEWAGVGQAGASIYVFNSDNGFWVESSAATAGNYATTTTYSGTISQVNTTFMAGRSYVTDIISGYVVDSEGNPYAGATVVSQGRILAADDDGVADPASYAGLAYGLTDDEGAYTVPMKSGSEALVYSVASTQSRTAEVDPDNLSAVFIELEDSSTTITLTWGEDPADLDSHFFGPDSTGGRFHVYYVNKEVIINGTTIFLDVDDVTSFGPEVTTVPRFPRAGTYEFFVKKFSGDSTIQASPARVEVNLQGEVFLFNPPSGSPTDCWHVFNVTVDSALRGEIQLRNNWVASSACDNGLGGGGGSFLKPTREVTGNASAPAMEAIRNKYYAQPIAE